MGRKTRWDIVKINELVDLNSNTSITALINGLQSPTKGRDCQIGLKKKDLNIYSEYKRNKEL